MKPSLLLPSLLGSLALLGACGAPRTADVEASVAGGGSGGPEVGRTPGVEIVLLSDRIDLAQLEEWAHSTVEALARPEMDVLVIVYAIEGPTRMSRASWHPLGEVPRGRPTLDSSQVERAMEALQRQLDQAGVSAGLARNEAATVRESLEGGYVAAFQSPLSRDVRYVLIGAVEQELRWDPEDFEHVFFHELYHAFQHELSCEREARGEDLLWAVEAGASYFAEAMVARNHGRDDAKFESDLLRTARRSIRRGGPDLVDPGIAEKGAAAFRLMIGRGWLDEASVLDGSLYHDCGWVDLFRAGEPRMQEVLRDYPRIRRTRGVYHFITP